MTTYTIQVANDPDAAVCPTWRPDLWQTVHDGALESDHAAKGAALELAAHYRFVRVARDGAPWYIPPQIPRKQQELIP